VGKIVGIIVIANLAVIIIVAKIVAMNLAVAMIAVASHVAVRRKFLVAVLAGEGFMVWRLWGLWFIIYSTQKLFGWEF
jgi:hypothetical protein